MPEPRKKQKKDKAMKKIFMIFAALIAFAVSAIAEEAASFAQIKHDFGTFSEAKGKVTHTFEFTNTSKAPIVLQDVKASCGCTTPTWTKTPVAPGEKGQVEVTYNAKGRPGAFSKTITVTSNQGVTRLMIVGEVLLEKDANKEELK